MEISNKENGCLIMRQPFVILNLINSSVYLTTSKNRPSSVLLTFASLCPVNPLMILSHCHFLGKSNAGLPLKKSNGRSSKECQRTGITGQSSALTI